RGAPTAATARIVLPAVALFLIAGKRSDALRARVEAHVGLHAIIRENRSGVRPEGGKGETRHLPVEERGPTPDLNIEGRGLTVVHRSRRRVLRRHCRPAHVVKA